MSPQTLRARWLTPEGYAARDAFIRELRGNRDWREAIRSVVDPTVADGCDLRGIDLSGFDLRGCELSYVAGDYATFDGADLRETNFQNSALSRSRFLRANLHGAQFVQVHAPESIFNGADFGDSFAMCSNFTSASFRATLLVRAGLSGARCASADFTDADLTGADFFGTDLTSAVFINARVEPERLRHAIFRPRE